MVCRCANLLDGSIPVPKCAPSDTWNITLSPKKITLKSGLKIIIEVANDNDKYKVEGLIRAAAFNGEGFAVDEFTEEGHFNYKFFRKFATIVAKNTTDSLLGAVILGPSSLCRNHQTDTITGYCVVEKSFRQLGIGKCLG